MTQPGVSFAEILRSRDVLFTKTGLDTVTIKVASADKGRFAAHVRNIRVFTKSGGPPDNPAGEITSVFGFKVRYLDQMRPGVVAFADKNDKVIGYAELSLDDIPGPPPDGMLRPPLP
jgi:hypothetical protein